MVLISPIEETSEKILAQLDKKEWYLPTLERLGDYRKQEWLSVRLAFKNLFNEEKEILYYPNGKPYLADASHHISISHTKGYVAVIANKEKEVAIDIEYISPRVEKIKKRFLSSEEEEHLSTQNKLIHTILHWSAKECLFKILNANNVEFKSQLHILPFEPAISKWGKFNAFETRTDQKRLYIIHYFVSEEYVITFCETDK